MMAQIAISSVTAPEKPVFAVLRPGSMPWPMPIYNDGAGYDLLAEGQPAGGARTWRAKLLESAPAGPLALRRGKPGQVGNEAATVTTRKCRGPGSPLFCNPQQALPSQLLPGS